MVFNIYRKRYISILIIILGFSNVISAFIKNEYFIDLLSGGLMIFIGILTLGKPAIVIDKKNIYIKNAFGVTQKVYPYTLDTLSYENNSFWIGNKKIKTFGWLIDKKSLSDFLDYLKKNKKLS